MFEKGLRQRTMRREGLGSRCRLISSSDVLEYLCTNKCRTSGSMSWTDRNASGSGESPLTPPSKVRVRQVLARKAAGESVRIVFMSLSLKSILEPYWNPSRRSVACVRMCFWQLRCPFKGFYRP